MNSSEQPEKTSEQAFRTLVEHLPAVTYIVELGEPHRTSYVSPQIERLLGYTPSEWLANPDLWRERLHPDDREWVTRELERRDRTGEAYYLEYRLLARDGRTVWVRNEAVYSRDEHDRPTAVHGVMLDITERKKAEGESRKLAQDLGGRVKELSCLFGISNLVERPDVTLEEILRGVLDLIPPSWQYPEDTCARLRCEAFDMATANFRQTEWKLVGQVPVWDKPCGTLEVYYLHEHPPRDEGPFLAEERMLLDVISVRVGRIIQRFRAEEELNQVRQRYADLVNNLTVGVYRNTPGPEGRFIEANPKLVSMFEADSKEEFLRHSVMDLYQDPAQRAAFSRKMMEQGYVRNEELELVTLKGRPFWAAVTAVKKEDKDGQVYFDGVVEDITERKQAEEQLRLQSTALSVAANGIVITDPEGMVVWVNPAFTELTGYEADEAVGQSTRILKSGKQTQAFYKDMWDTITRGEVWRGELVNRRKDGSLYTEDMTITPVLDDEGRVTHYVAIKQDVTSRRKAEAELSRYTELLQARNVEMQSDLKMAREVQEALLPQQYPAFPPSAAPEDSALYFCHRYLPSGDVGGDFFDVLPLSDTSVGVFLCDVMGHGMRAALVTAIVRGISEELTLVADDPGKFLSELNRDFAAVFKHAERGLFATAFYLVADLRSAEIIYASAGHPSPLCVSRRRREVQPLSFDEGSRGPALGLIEDADYRSTRCPLDIDDLLVLYTDGLCEIERPDREAFGEERLIKAIRQRMDEEPDPLFDDVIRIARDFSQGRGFNDDVCLVGMEVRALGPLTQ